MHIQYGTVFQLTLPIVASAPDDTTYNSRYQKPLNMVLGRREADLATAWINSMFFKSPHNLIHRVMDELLT